MLGKLTSKNQITIPKKIVDQLKKGESMNRIDRLTAILVQLQSKRIIKAREIADPEEFLKAMIELMGV